MSDKSKAVQFFLSSQVEEQKTTLQFEEVWSKFEEKQATPSKFKIQKVGIVAFLFFLISTPVGASIYLNWHNIELKFEDENQLVLPTTGEVPWVWLDFDMYPMLIDSYKNVDLYAAKKISDFEILRPSDFEMPLLVSAGVIGEKEEKVNAYWDIFQDGDKWIYVRQSLHVDSKRILSESEMKLTFHLPMETKVVPMEGKDAIALLTDEGEGGKRIQMLMKNNKDQVINFEIRGNIGEEGVIQLARSFIK